MIDLVAPAMSHLLKNDEFQDLTALYTLKEMRSGWSVKMLWHDFDTTVYYIKEDEIWISTENDVNKKSTNIPFHPGHYTI